MQVHDIGSPCGRMQPGDEELTDPEEFADVTCPACRLAERLVTEGLAEPVAQFSPVTAGDIASWLTKNYTLTPREAGR